jgi:hypothetical protein
MVSRVRRFNRRHGFEVFLVLVVALVLGVVALLMYLLTNPSYIPGG